MTVTKPYVTTLLCTVYFERYKKIYAALLSIAMKVCFIMKWPTCFIYKYILYTTSIQRIGVVYNFWSHKSAMNTILLPFSSHEFLTFQKQISKVRDGSFS